MPLPSHIVGDPACQKNWEASDTRMAPTTWAAEITPFVPKVTVTSLPGSPTDGQEIFYLADSNGVVWHLRYRAGGGTYKWEFVGGRGLEAATQGAGDVATASGYTGTLTANNISVAVPLAGVYDVEVSTNFASNNTATAYAQIGFTFSGETPGATFVAAAYAPAVNTGCALFYRRRGTLTASGTFGPIYQASAGTASFFRNRINFTPVRVG